MILRRLARTSQVLTPQTTEPITDFQPTWCLRPARGRCLTPWRKPPAAKNAESTKTDHPKNRLSFADEQVRVHFSPKVKLPISTMRLPPSRRRVMDLFSMRPVP